MSEEPSPPQLESHQSFEPPESTSRYFQVMKSLRYSSSDFGPSYAYPVTDYDDLGAVDGARLHKEIKSLVRDLPCESASSIFVSMDSVRMYLLKAAISGPEDTPYAHGLYVFDIGLRSSYPLTPPLVRITTTGGGNVRFNPNLYADGYVCLSIINTWDSSPEEMWNPSESTILGVLVSIQSLVMDTQVLQKEPGYESYTASDPGNLAYCAVVRYNNIKFAMRKMIEHPPEEFKEVVQKHFFLKREEILRTCDLWHNEAALLTDFSAIDYLVMDHNPHTIQKFQEKGYQGCLAKQIEKLRIALSTLPPVE